ncbi:MAG TPA: c-type cytochrome [Saprospiraceae bacterium]|jgi:hypothetical protein|nr:c-type cytochrome [Saprospiraceae bacterium]HRO08672.1 c-type cytochrome [Saprospiraceae bacterium]HRP42740.1 c-type cytochrome [Saprospiraceae bacterium]
MKNNILIFLGFVSFMLLAVSFTPGIQSNEYDMQVMQQPKNLKILPKDINPEELKAIMKSFNESLGVKCGFCHVPSADGQGLDFASDENMHKEIARGMMVMTKEINQKYFDMYPHEGFVNQISCMTCHNGQKEAYHYKKEVEK